MTYKIEFTDEQLKIIFKALSIASKISLDRDLVVEVIEHIKRETTKLG